MYYSVVKVMFWAGPLSVVGIIRNYYEFLYEDKPSDANAADTLLNELRGRKLPSLPRKSCEGDISEKELLAIMGKIPVNKSAGPDKIPGLFYKLFKTELAPIPANVLNTSKNYTREDALQAAASLLQVLGLHHWPTLSRDRGRCVHRWDHHIHAF